MRVKSVATAIKGIIIDIPIVSIIDIAIENTKRKSKNFLSSFVSIYINLSKINDLTLKKLKLSIILLQIPFNSFNNSAVKIFICFPTKFVF